MGRIAIMLGVAVPLAAADLYMKATQPTEPWAYHARSLGWLVLSVGVFLALLLVSQVPSRVVAPAAGLLAAGILGNTLSAAWNGMEVPNPLVVYLHDVVIAYNLADVWALGGIVLLVAALGTWLVQNRDLLPPTREPVLGRLRGAASILPSHENLEDASTVVEREGVH